MYINHLEFSKIFDEKEVIDDEAGIYRYKKYSNNGYTCIAVLFFYDQFLSLSLEHKSLPYSLCHIGFEEIEKIEIINHSLHITEVHNSVKSIFKLLPNFSLEMHLP